MFQFWDWVGGRYSLMECYWSYLLHLPLVTKILKNLLKGAHDTDNHFRDTAFEKNIPVLMALDISLWYINFFGAQTEAIFPMINTCTVLPLIFSREIWKAMVKVSTEMVKTVNYATGPVIWGEPGTNGQHAFYQLIHQGTLLIPCDFIAPAQYTQSIR